MSAQYEILPPGGHEAYATSIFSKIKTYLDSNPYGPVKDIPNTPIAIATFDDGSDLPMPKLEVAIEPQQDLHGYDAPWVGGAGKNKLAMNISDIKNLNTTGTWNGDTYTVNGAKYKINIDTAGNITSINARSVASNPNGDLKIATTLPANSYILSSGFTETNGVNDTFLQKDGVTIARGNNSSPGSNFAITESSEVVLHIRLSRNDSSFICTPMIRLSSVSDATFAPYSNECPISGWSAANVSVSGVNVWNEEWVNGYYNQGQFIFAQDAICCKNKISVKPNTNMYYVKDFSAVSNFYYTFYDINGNFLPLSGYDASGRYARASSGIISVPNNAYYMTFNMGAAYGTTYNNDISINYPPTNTSYHAYNGHTYNIDLDGTRYGGTLDVVSGELVVDRIKWTITPNVSHIMSCNISDCIIFLPSAYYPNSYNVTINKGISDKLKVTNYSAQHDDHIHFPNASLLAVFVTDEVGTTKQEWVDYLAQKQIEISYLVATPQSIQLTPTQVKSLLWVNNVWADTGDILDAEYIRDKYDNITAKYAAYAYNSGNADTATSATTASKLGSSNVGSATQPIYLNGGTATACTYTLGKSVPSDAVFTDTKVTQTATDVSSNAEYEVLFSETADDTTRTEGTRKTSLFTFNPQTNEVAAGHFAAKSDSPSGNKTANLLGYDIQLGGTSNTWDGTHTSLKDTIAYLNSHFAPSAHDHNYLVSAGTNTQSTSSTAYALGSFNVRWFNATGKLPGQPAQYGFLLTTATGTSSVENHQIFVEQPNGNLYHRGTNGSTSSSPPAFKTILDSSNYTSYTRNSSGVIKVNSVTKTPTNAGTSLASPTPSIDSGYKFLCWLYVQSNGYIVGASYPGGAANPSATWWFANGYLANYALTFYYLEIKDTI